MFAVARLFCLAGLCLLAACVNAAAADLYTEINLLRSSQSRCALTESLPPLRPEPALERVARELARGAKLDQAMKAAGFRSTRSTAFSIRGEGVGARVAALLARPDQCRQLRNAAMSAVGVYLDDGQVWVVMAAPFAPAVAVSQLTAGQTVLTLTNQARATPRSCGDKAFGAAAPLRWNETLAGAARQHAEDMAGNNFFSHGGRDGSTPGQRVERAGYRFRATGENIAGGQMKPEDAVAGWIKSPPHCATLMNPLFTDMGVAYAVDAKSAMGVYWAQSFGVPR